MYELYKSTFYLLHLVTYLRQKAFVFHCVCWFVVRSSVCSLVFLWPNILKTVGDRLGSNGPPVGNGL